MPISVTNLVLVLAIDSTDIWVGKYVAQGNLLLNFYVIRVVLIGSVLLARAYRNITTKRSCNVLHVDSVPEILKIV